MFPRDEANEHGDAGRDQQPHERVEVLLAFDQRQQDGGHTDAEEDGAE